MKRLVVALAATIAACSQDVGQKGDANNGDSAPLEELQAAAEEAEPISAMLKAGKPEACAHPAVKAELLAETRSAPESVRPEYSVTQADIDQAIQTVGEPSISDFQALESDASVGALACFANVKLNPGPTGFRYILRPSLENESEFMIAYVSSYGGPGQPPSTTYRYLIFNEARRLANARQSEEQEPEASSEATEPETVTAM